MSTKETFFREFTMRICSSLSIKTALTRVVEYLKDFMPIDKAAFPMRDDSLQAFRAICRVGCLDNYPEILRVPDHIWNDPKSWSMSLPFIVDKSMEYTEELNAIANQVGCSHIVVPLRVEDRYLGCLSLVANGTDRYNLSHLELLEPIAQPTAIAFANAVAHEDLLRYRDLLVDDNSFLHRELLGMAGSEIIGADGGLRQVVELVQQVAPLNNTVLLLGETGTGKEVIANAIHFASPRRDGPFIKVNCGAIPESLIDSELFGHEKGAFTGATGDKRGRFERASRGTIFLDEIGELPLQAQVRLLRVLQYREVDRVGGTKPIPVDIRVIAATNRNLESMVAERTFREDLWFRLNVFPLTIPPLRQRREDIPALTRHFLLRKSLELGLRAPPQVAPGVLERLEEYCWPGNVRELENLIERELILYRGGYLTFETLVPFRDSEPRSLEANTLLVPSATPLDEVIRTHIENVLKLTGGKIHGCGGAAEVLKIKATTLRDRMDKLGIPYRR
jgi:transcriptional regulator with GAF, ATPase, and Fis domain